MVEREKGDWHNLKILLPYLKPYWPYLAIGIGMGFVASSLRVLTPVVQGLVVKDIAPHMSEGQDTVAWLWNLLGGRADQVGALVPLLAVLFFSFITFRYLLDLTQLYLLQKFGQLVLYNLREKLFHHMLHLPMSFYQRQPVGKLITRVSNDIEALSEFIATGLSDLTRHGFTVVAISVVLPLVAWELGLAALALGPVVVAVSAVFRYFARRAYRALREKISQWNVLLAETIGGMVVVRSFGREAQLGEKMIWLDRELTEKHIRSIQTWALYSPTVSFIEGVSLAVILWLGYRYVSEGTLSVATLSVFVWLIHSFYDPIRHIAERYNLLQSALAASERIFHVLETEVDPLLETPECVLPSDFPRGNVVFQKVSFRYGPHLPWALKDISFSVPAGTKVALVGHTGAGKSTLIKLLLRFFDPQEGQILVDGQPLRNVAPRQWRKCVAVVPQEVFLFEGTILENIRLWDHTISEEKVRWAAEMVQAHLWIEELPQGYHTVLREGARELSAGQRQLLSFARALVREPKILILDEATALIDTETERAIQEALAALTEGRTSFVIAHRLSTVQDADLILVLEKGELVEQGTHEELLRQKGRYHYLYTAQFRHSWQLH